MPTTWSSPSAASACSAPGYDNTSSKTLFTTVMARDSVEGKKLPPEVLGIAKRIWPSLEKVEAVDKYTVRFVNRVPDVTLEGRIGRPASEIISRRGFMEAKTWIDWARKPIATGPYKVREFKPDEILIARRARRLLGRPAADQDASASSWCPRCRAASTAC